MKFNAATPSFRRARDATAQRLGLFPESPFFLFANKELDRIERQIESRPIDRSFYDSLNIGLMCARELETSDMEYCNIIYEMLEDMRISIS